MIFHLPIRQVDVRNTLSISAHDHRYLSFSLHWYTNRKSEGFITLRKTNNRKPGRGEGVMMILDTNWDQAGNDDA
jgi:hypothetical protein